MLTLEHLHTRIGASPVHRDVSVTVGRGEVVAILGSNGAGKTSLLRAAMGLLPLVSGKMMWDGVDVSRRPAHARNKLGLAYVPEGRRIFGDMSVLENLEIGSYGIEPPREEVSHSVQSMY